LPLQEDVFPDTTISAGVPEQRGDERDGHTQITAIMACVSPAARIFPDVRPHLMTDAQDFFSRPRVGASRDRPENFRGRSRRRENARRKSAAP